MTIEQHDYVSLDIMLMTHDQETSTRNWYQNRTCWICRQKNLVPGRTKDSQEYRCQFSGTRLW